MKTQDIIVVILGLVAVLSFIIALVTGTDAWFAGFAFGTIGGLCVAGAEDYSKVGQ